MTTITLNLHDLLVGALGGQATHVPATVDVRELLDFNDLYEADQDLDDLLRGQRMVASVWTTGHVRSRRPDLTDDQAWAVLAAARDDFERDRCHLDFIESTADHLFPPPGEAKRRLAERVRSLLRQVEALPDAEGSDPAAYGSAAAAVDAIEQFVRGA